MPYLLDTVTVIRHFTNSGRIGKKARQALSNIEADQDIGAISVVSLMEIMYLAERNRIQLTLTETLELIEKSSNYFVVDLTPEILKHAAKIDFPELHDRLIIATAYYLNVPVISGDREFKNVAEVNAIWD